LDMAGGSLGLSRVLTPDSTETHSEVSHTDDHGPFDNTAQGETTSIFGLPSKQPAYTKAPSQTMIPASPNPGEPIGLLPFVS